MGESYSMYKPPTSEIHRNAQNGPKAHVRLVSSRRPSFTSTSLDSPDRLYLFIRPLASRDAFCTSLLVPTAHPVNCPLSTRNSLPVPQRVLIQSLLDKRPTRTLSTVFPAVIQLPRLLLQYLSQRCLIRTVETLEYKSKEKIYLGRLRLICTAPPKDFLLPSGSKCSDHALCQAPGRVRRHVCSGKLETNARVLSRIRIKRSEPCSEKLD